MKYRDPKTGEVFEDIRTVRERVCSGHECDNCPLNQFNQGELYGHTCVYFVKEYPAEAARLMGLEVVEDDIDLINRISKTPLTKSEVYIFSVRLCDNEVDRDYERFSTQTLEVFAGLFVGKICSLAHQCSAQIYRTELVRDTEKKTAAGDEYCCLKGWAYMLRNENSKGVIAEIEGNIKKEVSIGCGIGRSVCSICGAEADTCGHVKGQTYDGRLCFRELQNPADAFEWSFVATPAKKEEPMEKTDRPRICEVLGVEVGEPFKIEGYNGEYHINDDGVLKWGGQTSDDAIYEAINHPDRIIRKPRFTEEEVAVLRHMSSAGVVSIEKKAETHLYWDGVVCGGVMVVPAAFLPSLRPGQAVKLEEIIPPADR